MKIKMEVNKKPGNENSDINNVFPTLLVRGIIEIAKIMVLYLESETSENTSN